MAANPNDEEIMAAIRESGYLMEQEVATQLERRGLHVFTNVAFQDLDEGKSREIDVRAIKRVAIDETAKIAAFVELIVECKNSSNPYVFLTRPKNQRDKNNIPDEFLIPFKYRISKNQDGVVNSKEIPAFHYLGFDRVFDAHLCPWKAVQFCRIDRNGKGWHANHGGLYDSIFYPLAKALSSRRTEVRSRVNTSDWRNIWLFFPLVVTSGDLYLIDSSSEAPRPEPVSHISFQRELKSESLSGNFTVTFVRQHELEAFLTAVVDPLVDLSAELINKQRDFLLKTDLPWVDQDLPD